MLRSRVKKMENSVEDLNGFIGQNEDLGDAIRREIDGRIGVLLITESHPLFISLLRLAGRITNLENTLSELTGTAPGLYSQVDILRRELNQLIAATNCRRREVPEVPAVPAHVVIEKIRKGE